MPEPSPSTIVTVFAARVRQDADGVAMLVAGSSDFKPVTWRELASAVAACVENLRQLGVQPQDRVVQWAENSREWLVADLAILAVGAVHVPLHATLTAVQACAQIAAADPACVFVSTPDKASALGQAIDVPVLSHAAEETIPDTAHGDGSDAWRNLLNTLPDVDAEQPATILFTSGTTGESKGIVLSHANLLANTRAVLQAFPHQDSDLRLCFLPCSHVFARTCDLYSWLLGAGCLAFARSRESVIEDCQTLKPTLLNGVPYFFEKLHQAVTAQHADPPPGALQATLGGRLRICCSGGAALSDATFDFFLKQQLPLLQGYGLTETSPVVSLSTAEHYRRGTVGRPLPGVEVRIAPDGEILTRGPNLMLGYWRDPAATSQVILDGWFHTGDLGSLDEDGYLRITGRKKELIVIATGKNVFPAQIESLLCQDPLIEQACVVGDGRNHLAALILARPEHHPPDAAGALNRLREQVAMAIVGRLSDLAPHEQVRRFRLIESPFSPDNGLLTPKLSLRRTAIAQHYQSEIEAMYDSDAFLVGPLTAPS